MDLTPEEPQDPVEKRREQWRTYYQLHGAAAKRKKRSQTYRLASFFQAFAKTNSSAAV